jgi:hypothetical protein
LPVRPAGSYSLANSPALSGAACRADASRTTSIRSLAMDDNLKAPLVVFNLTVGLFMTPKWTMPMGTMFLHLLIGAAIGLVLGGITFVVMRKK